MGRRGDDDDGASFVALGLVRSARGTELRPGARLVLIDRGVGVVRVARLDREVSRDMCSDCVEGGRPGGEKVCRRRDERVC